MSRLPKPSAVVFVANVPRLCLPVESIATARTTAARLGGTIRPAGSEWEARGFRACDGHDPEGNVLQVRENAELAWILSITPLNT